MIPRWFTIASLTPVVFHLLIVLLLKRVNRWCVLHDALDLVNKHDDYEQEEKYSKETCNKGDHDCVGIGKQEAVILHAVETLPHDEYQSVSRAQSNID